jgi:mono/diheme cytochrome c family protein
MFPHGVFIREIESRPSRTKRTHVGQAPRRKAGFIIGGGETLVWSRSNDLRSCVWRLDALIFPGGAIAVRLCFANQQVWRMPMRLLALIGVLAIVVVIGALIFFFGGYYNVAGIEEDPGVVAWALAAVRAASIDRHASDQPPISLNDPATVQAGARAFVARGCVNCHGGPGVGWGKFAEGMRPYPPVLKDIAKERDLPQLFWVAKNGVKMTGMPSFGSIGVPDLEIWTIAAFVKKLPNVSDADFKAWTAAP